MKTLTTLTLLSATLALLALPAAAQLTLTLTPDPALLVPGNSILLLATLTNTSAEAISLDSTSGNIVGPSALLTLDDSTFLAGLPLSLAASGGQYTSSLSVSAALGASLGDYTLSYDVDGTGLTTTSAYTGSGTATITVTTASSAPEPAAFLLMGSGLIVLAHRCRRLI